MNIMIFYENNFEMQMICVKKVIETIVSRGILNCVH